MGKWPTVTYADHAAFCRIEGWREVRNARGVTGSHHITYELDLPDGRVLRTRVSHPADKTSYGPRLRAHVMRDQLDINEAEFWACVQEKTRPARSRVADVLPEAIDASIVFLLITQVGLSEAQVKDMSRQQAIAALNEHWSRPR